MAQTLLSAQARARCAAGLDDGAKRTDGETNDTMVRRLELDAMEKERAFDLQAVRHAAARSGVSRKMQTCSAPLTRSHDAARAQGVDRGGGGGTRAAAAPDAGAAGGSARSEHRIGDQRRRPQPGVRRSSLWHLIARADGVARCDNCPDPRPAGGTPLTNPRWSLYGLHTSQTFAIHPSLRHT